MAQDATGSFFVIEGTEGSGKSVQFSLLQQALEKNGYDVVTFDFPRYQEPSSYFVRQYLQGAYGNADSVGPYTSSLFFALDRYEAGAAIRQALAEGKVVLANRYAGSNMAHQGTKFNNPEERRGYFLWIDNLEFLTLGIPRPTTSLVLRVPAKTAFKLSGQKTTSMANADYEHIKRSVEVYDNLCDLFPKDFQAIDCVRSGQLMKIEQIHSLIWQRLQPLLPTRKQPTSQSAPETTSNTVHRPDGVFLQVNDVSELFAAKLQSSRLATFEVAEMSLDTPRYLVPKELDVDTQDSYVKTMDQLVKNYQAAVGQLKAYFELQAAEQSERGGHMQAVQLARAILPTATYTNVGILASQRAIEAVVSNLQGNNLPEARRESRKIFEHAGQQLPALLANHEEQMLGGIAAYHFTNQRTLRVLAKEYLPADYGLADEPAVTLSSVWPRNEFDIVPEFLYPSSTLSLKAIREAVKQWSYQQKADVLRAYFGERLSRDHNPGRATNLIHYNWDIVSSFQTMRQLQHTDLIDELSQQAISPRYGYEIPEEVEAAGLSDLFEASFDMSLQLFSLLQSRGFDQEASYAALMGHRVRWSFSQTARQAIRLQEIATHPNNTAPYKKLILAMHQRVAEVHPTIASAMKFVGQGDDAALARLAAQRYMQYRTQQLDA